MDLPKGFVEDDSRAHLELARQTTMPLTAIIQFWKVYTTTTKQLYDPTARRLENFWWHVWGSDRRNLNPQTIAAIWHHIAFGPSFVPLKGSPNRFEPPPDYRSNSQHELDSQMPKLPRHLDADVILQRSSAKELSSSSSRPPPPHPILKKSRGDSKSGPRPTARFVSPPGSEAGEEPARDETSSESNTSGALEMRPSSSTSPSTKPARKKGHGSTKRVVPVKPAVKRRPVLSRRQSSQSSTASSDVAVRGGPAVSSGQSQAYDNTELAGPGSPATPNDQATPGSEKSGMPALSDKALGKRPMLKPASPAYIDSLPSSTSVDRPALDVIKEGVRHETPTETNNETLGQDSFNSAVFSDKEGRTESPVSPSVSTFSHGHRKSSTGSQSAMSTGKTERTFSSSSQQRPRQTSLGRNSSYGLLSNATASTSTVAATGQLSKVANEPDMSALEALGAIPDTEPARAELTRNPSTASLMKPTAPSSAPSVPMARSRSQLALLLAREKDR